MHFSAGLEIRVLGIRAVIRYRDSLDISVMFGVWHWHWHMRATNKNDVPSTGSVHAASANYPHIVKHAKSAHSLTQHSPCFSDIGTVTFQVDKEKHE